VGPERQPVRAADYVQSLGLSVVVREGGTSETIKRTLEYGIPPMLVLWYYPDEHGGGLPPRLWPRARGIGQPGVISPMPSSQQVWTTFDIILRKRAFGHILSSHLQPSPRPPHFCLGSYADQVCQRSLTGHAQERLHRQRPLPSRTRCRRCTMQTWHQRLASPSGSANRCGGLCG
jgi:hypothetical protein